MSANVPGPPPWKEGYLDGFLPDLFVEKWSPKDWETFLDFVASGPWRFVCTVEGEPISLPRTFQWINGVNPLLTLEVGTLEIDCHFFGEDDFELTLDPVEVKSEADYNAVLQFMSALAERLERRVLLCGENNHGNPLFAVEPLRTVVRESDAG